MENKEITPEQALNVLDKVTGTITASRADHQLIIQSLQVLAGLIPQQKEN